MSVLTGKQIDHFRVRMAISGLNLKIKTGMSLTRGFNAHKWLKDYFNIKGNKESVLKQSMKLYIEAVKETGDMELIERANKIAMGL